MKTKTTIATLITVAALFNTGSAQDSSAFGKRATDAPAVAPAKAEVKDPIIANWRIKGITVWRFSEDGKAKNDMFPNAPGIWKLESDNGGTRKYQVVWNDGGVVGTLAMDRNGTKLRYRDNQNQKFDLERVVEVPVK